MVGGRKTAGLDGSLFRKYALRRMRGSAVLAAAVSLVAAAFVAGSGRVAAAASSDSCSSAGVVQTQTSAADWLADPTRPLSSLSVPAACGALTSAGSAPASPSTQATSSTATGGGTIDTVAGGGIGDGGPGLDAELFLPGYAVYDSAGNLYVSVHGRVAKITPSGVPTTLAGTGTVSFRPKSGFNGFGGYYGD